MSWVTSPLAHELAVALGQTLLMVGMSGLLASLLGLPLGILLWTSALGQLFPQPLLQRFLSMIINALRSVPFIILMMAIIPLTRLLAGSSIGTAAAIVPLTLAAVPFMARIVESALAGVAKGLREAAQAMGATPLQIVWRVCLPEALPSMVQGVTLMLINLVGYAAMAGAVGGGGLGDFAIRYGYQRFDARLMAITVVVLIVLVQLIQWLGDQLSARLAHQQG